MRVQIKKWGNSAAVRIPASVMSAGGFRPDDAVEVREEGGQIVIEPANQPGYDLAALVAGITPDNVHGEIDVGPAVGKERL